ncbi:putative photosynthetic complex assembly protein PuhE [Roseomonas sp. CCTCC AB2023176]|uniref:putative photosynthetic complex assembly protein PuhE n=1 Tax=Roseomonas sp. CCTCC AB2023176 TaxID=3342640 RepID=UPI0035DF0417
MVEHLLPAVVAIFLWWFATGLILYLDGMRRETFAYSLGAATLLLGAAVFGLHATSDLATPHGAVVGFLGGLAIWGWLELAFLTGFVTGPERSACPPGLRGWGRFVRATRTLLHHELAILSALLWTANLTWDGPNRIGLWTVLLLFGMRLSSKLNLFLGVRNSNAEFLPDHLRYLGTYFGKARGNPLLPFSLAGSVAVAGLLLWTAFAPGADSFTAVGFTLLGTLAALGALEHALMLLPLPATLLWGWGFRSRGFSAELGQCDPGGLERLLQAVARGTYGRVDRLQGVVLVGEGWVRFDVAAGQPSLSPAAGQDGPGRVTATGRVDGSRLRAAFEACSATRMRRYPA